MIMVRLLLVGKTMPFAPSPSHHHFTGGIYIYMPFPVMAGKHDID